MIDKINTCCIHKVIPLAFDESMSYLEKLCNMLYKLNETIDKVNNLSEIVDNIDVNFKEINDKIAELNNTIKDISDELINTEKRIDNKLEVALRDQYNQVVKLMNDYQIIFNNKIDSTKAELEDKIENIELGNINAYDPTTGEFINISQALINIYDALRSGAITCGEFDALNLTCTSFEAYEITAFNFDLNAKSILI